VEQSLADTFEKLAQGIYLEGLAVDDERGHVWYSDVIRGGVHCLRRDGSTLSFNQARMWTGGITVNEDGSVLSTGPGGIMWSNAETGRSGWLLERIDGQPINGINEMATDGSGGIYFGTVDIERIEKGETPRPGSIYRLAATGELTLAADSLGFVNGMALSADGRQLFYCQTFDGVYAFDVAPDRSLSGWRRILEKEDCDGLALDASGVLWVTGFRSGALLRIRPDGTPVGQVPTPAGAITQVRFGGADMRDYYLTTVPADGGDSLKEGVQPTGEQSFLLRGRSDVAGLPIPRSRFELT
jgi:sugar lactone lactonase YvrE